MRIVDIRERTPGIGFEGKKDLIEVMRSLA